MYVKATAPRSIGGTIDDAIRLYRAALPKSWPLSLCGQLLIAVPVLILRMKLAGVSTSTGNPAAMLALVTSPSVWLSYLVVIVLSLAMYNALLVQINAVATAIAATAGQSFAVGLRLLPRSLLLLLAMLCILAVVGMAAGVLGAIHVSAILMSVFILALVVFGIYAWGRAFLANVALVVEDAGVFKSLGISWNLIKDHWWRTATVYTVAIIIAMVFYFVIAFAAGLIAALMRGSLETATILSQAVSVAGGTFLTPFFPAVLLALYYDLQLRKEGIDLSTRVNALAPK